MRAPLRACPQSGVPVDLADRAGFPARNAPETLGTTKVPAGRASSNGGQGGSQSSSIKLVPKVRAIPTLPRISFDLARVVGLVIAMIAKRPAIAAREQFAGLDCLNAAIKLSRSAARAHGNKASPIRQKLAPPARHSVFAQTCTSASEITQPVGQTGCNPRARSWDLRWQIDRLDHAFLFRPEVARQTAFLSILLGRGRPVQLSSCGN